jgi:hypothetical protein
MRNIQIVLLLGVILLGARCKKEELSPFRKNSWGNAKTEINGNIWTANVCKTNLNSTRDSVGIVLSNANNNQVFEWLGLGLLPLRVGVYPFPSKSLWYGIFIRGDNDLICATYVNSINTDVLEDYVEITEYNEQSKEIKGRFSCNMLINPEGSNAGTKCKPTDPDTLRIRNGVFHTKILN